MCNNIFRELIISEVAEQNWSRIWMKFEGCQSSRVDKLAMGVEGRFSAVGRMSGIGAV